MKENQTNRTDLYTIISIISFFITFWVQIVFGLLGRMDFLALFNFIVYAVSTSYFFNNVIEKEDPKRVRKIIFTTSIMLTILFIIYLIVYYIRIGINLDTSL